MFIKFENGNVQGFPETGEKVMKSLMTALKINVPEYFEERTLRIEYKDKSFYTSGVDSSTLKPIDCFRNVLINGQKVPVMDSNDENLEIEL